jgi:hypothetical protein
MASKQSEAPALFSLLVFLAVNYAAGFGIGFWLTHSTAGAIALALVTPCLSLLGIALVKKPARRNNKLDGA